MPFLDTLGRTVLGLVDVYPVRVRRGQVSGVSLPHDLAEVVTATRPLCLDVGANRGQTIRMLQTTLDSPTIHAFEPSPEAFAHLQASSVAPNVTLHNVALGARRDRREFIAYANGELSSLLEMDRAAANPFRDVAERARSTVNVDTVDDFLDERQIAHVDLLKIDTQGFDLEVLRGAERALHRSAIGAVLIEINFLPMYTAQAGFVDVLAFLDGRHMSLVGYYERMYRAGILAWCTALFRQRPSSGCVGSSGVVKD